MWDYGKDGLWNDIVGMWAGTCICQEAPPTPAPTPYECNDSDDWTYKGKSDKACDWGECEGKGRSE